MLAELVRVMNVSLPLSALVVVASSFAWASALVVLAMWSETVPKFWSPLEIWALLALLGVLPSGAWWWSIVDYARYVGILT
jgi:hypothetical protein